MSRQFYKQFISAEDNIIAFFGDQLKSSLINALAMTSVNQGKYAIILGDKPKKYPVEGKVLVCDELIVLDQLVEKDKPELLYVASKIKNDLLHPFTKKEVKKLINNIDKNFILFLDFDANTKLNSDMTAYLRDAKLICSVNFNLIQNILPQMEKIKSLKTKSIDQQISDKFYSAIKKLCPEFSRINETEKRILFIDQVKGLYDENVIISIARNLKPLLNCQVLIGNSNSYDVKAI
jgi:hypothetical protein